MATASLQKYRYICSANKLLTVTGSSITCIQQETPVAATFDHRFHLVAAVDHATVVIATTAIGTAVGHHRRLLRGRRASCRSFGRFGLVVFWITCIFLIFLGLLFLIVNVFAIVSIGFWFCFSYGQIIWHIGGPAETSQAQRERKDQNLSL
uniref:Uncharacterized protein n=1 Tax=Anopheles farauti TaxID=69004 RepID=A0A182Q507_9DIPT